MKVIIHMGNYKTGSTTIQNFLYQNRDTLSHHNIYYGMCDNPPLASHALFAYSLLRKVLIQAGCYEKYSSYPAFNLIDFTPEDKWNEIVSESQHLGCDTIILSHESLFCEIFRTFCGLHHNPDNQMALHILASFHQLLYQLIHATSKDIEIVIYLRRQDDYLESQYNQYCKYPWYEPDILLPNFKEFCDLSPVTLDYTAALDIISHIYGNAAVNLRLFPVMTNPQTDFAHNILHLSDKTIDTLSSVDLSVQNKSLSYDAIEFKRKFAADPHANNIITDILTKYSLKHPDTYQYTYIDNVMRGKLSNKYSAINQSICKQYNISKDTYAYSYFCWNDNGAHMSDKWYTDLSEEQFLDILNFIETYSIQ